MVMSHLAGAVRRGGDDILDLPHLHSQIGTGCLGHVHSRCQGLCPVSYSDLEFAVRSNDA